MSQESPVAFMTHSFDESSVRIFWSDGPQLFQTELLYSKEDCLFALEVLLEKLSVINVFQYTALALEVKLSSLPMSNSDVCEFLPFDPKNN